MEFPHMGDTDFPLLNNVNVYAYRNEFDYTRWGVSTHVKLTNVLWNSDYNDVVVFDSATERDAWFDSRTDTYDKVLTESHQIPPEGGIKLPIPFDVAVRYNYMVVDVQPMTDANRPIAYEEDYGVRRWYFFIDTVESRAPNTTRFMLSLDVWTQYQNDIDIKYLFLERGHAPVAATDVDTYLANPIANNEYLLTPDVTPSRASVTRSARFIPFGNNTKWICLASTVGPEQIGALGAVTHNDPDYTYGTLTFSDTTERYGHQLEVDGFGMGNGDNYSNLHLRTSPTARVSARNRIQNNVSVYAFSSTDVTFVRDVMAECPNFFNSVQASFVVDSEMFEALAVYEIAGHELRHVRGVSDSIELDALDKSMFHYPQEYRRFAKLYTSPYATLQLTDNEGKTVDVAIENTGTITAHRVAELAFPFLKTRMFFTGINGTGSTYYQWVTLDGTNANRQIYDSDWFDYCFDHDIPCYALYMDGEKAWYLDNFNRTLRGGRNDALVQYHATMRSANTQRENVIDSDAVIIANAAANATTTVANAAADATTLTRNTSADATTLTTNTANNGTTMQDNVSLTISTNADKASFANNTSNLLTGFANDKQTDLTDASTYIITSTVGTQNLSTTQTTFNSIAGNIAGSVGATAVGMALAGGALGSVVPGVGNMAGAGAGLTAGALVGLSNVVSGSAASAANAAITINADAASAQATLDGNGMVLDATTGYNTAVTTNTNVERTYDIGKDNQLLDAHTDNNVHNNNTNAGNTAATMNANATRTAQTMNDNAGRTAQTMNDNAGRTADVQDDNATYTRGAVEANAKEAIRNSRLPRMYEMYDARNATPRQIGAYAGDPTADYMMNRGVQVKVRTMPDAEVRQVGDWFARYGYALEQVWDVSRSGLCPMNHFCYWKCRDAWVDDRKSSNNAVQQLIVAMLDRGVTMWKNPDEVGRVSIYDN